MPRPTRGSSRFEIGSSIWVACSVLAGCILEDPTAAGVVVLDPAAVETGASIEQHLAARPATGLPLLVDADARVLVRSRSHAQAFLVAPGELVHVRGEELDLFRHTLGGDVASDRVALVASRETVRELAAQMSAEVADLESGMFELRVAHAFVHLSHMSAEHVLEVQPLPREAARQSTHRLAAEAQGLRLRALDDGAPAQALPAVRELDHGVDPVGIYGCDDGQLILDAAGRFSGCTLRWGVQRGGYVLSGRTLTLDAQTGRRSFDVGADGSLAGEGGVRCAFWDGTAGGGR